MATAFWKKGHTCQHGRGALMPNTQHIISLTGKQNVVASACSGKQSALAAR